MTVPEVLASLSILAFMFAFACHIIDDIRKVGAAAVSTDSSRCGPVGDGDGRGTSIVYDWAEAGL